MTKQTDRPSAAARTTVKGKGKNSPFPLRLYLLLLLLVCLCLNGGLWAFSYMTYREAYDREVQLLTEDGHTLILMTDGFLTNPHSMGTSYSTHAAAYSFLAAKRLAFTNGTEWGSQLTLEGQSWTPPPYESTDTVTRQSVNGETYLCYTFRVLIQLTETDTFPPPTALTLVTGTVPTYYLLRNIQALEEQHNTLTGITCLASLVVTVTYAVVSWLLLRRYPVTLCPAEAVASDDTDGNPTDPVPCSQAHSIPQNDLGLLCRQRLEHWAEEAEERGVLPGGSAQTGCFVRCDTDGLILLVDGLLRLGVTSLSEGDHLRVLVTKRDASVTLTVTAEGAILDGESLAASRQAALSLGGELTAEGGTVTVTWEPRA